MKRSPPHFISWNQAGWEGVPCHSLSSSATGAILAASLSHVTFTSSTCRSCIGWRRVLTRHQCSAASQHHDGSLFSYTWDDCDHALYYYFFLQERALTVVMASKMFPFLPRPCWFCSVPGRQTGASRYQCRSGVCRLGLCFWMILKWKRHQMSLSLVHHD